jgi:hypothetical protein
MSSGEQAPQSQSAPVLHCLVTQPLPATQTKFSAQLAPPGSSQRG